VTGLGTFYETITLEFTKRKVFYMDDLLSSSALILNSLSDGVYVCDCERVIAFWSKSAEQITGWKVDDVIGHRCLEDILCHEDKDGHKLCGEEHCPLHRSIITGEKTEVPLIIFAQGKDGNRIPMQVTAAPIRNSEGEIIGGVETFRDMSLILRDLEKAKRIQEWSLKNKLPDDPRIKISTFYMPYDIVGGDYYAVNSLDEDRYGFLLADMEGHGVAAGLYTIHLSNLWNKHHELLKNPAEFITVVNNELGQVVENEDSFATAICGLIDAKTGMLRLVGSGGPPPFKINAKGDFEQLYVSGLVLGVMQDVQYKERIVQLDPGDSLLLVSDGAFEIHNSKNELLDTDGLNNLLKKLNYPQTPLNMEALEQELLKFSNEIRLQDDVTIIEINFLG